MTGLRRRAEALESHCMYVCRRRRRPRIAPDVVRAAHMLRYAGKVDCKIAWTFLAIICIHV